MKMHARVPFQRLPGVPIFQLSNREMPTADLVARGHIDTKLASIQESEPLRTS